MNKRTNPQCSLARVFILSVLTACWFLLPCSAEDTLDLCKVFQNPPTEANPWVMWYWMEGAVSREGITADLEAMKDVGIGGAFLMPIRGPGDPPMLNPPIVQLTPEFWAMVRHAMNEADRLGLKIGMHACDGFATAGGPWITPELSMQRVVWSKTILAGERDFSDVLEQPETNEGFYRDIAVLAFPTPDGEVISTRTVIPRVTTSLQGVDARFLVEPSNTRSFRSENRCWIQYEFDQPFTCRSIIVRPRGNNFQSQRLAIEVSEDGKEFRSLGHLDPPRHGWQDAGVPLTYALAPTTGRFFRFVFDRAGTEPGSEDLDSAKWKPVFNIEGLELSSEPRIDQFEAKTARLWRIAKRTSAEQLPDSLCVPLGDVVDLTADLDSDGVLRWRVPAGRWTVLRIGHTSTGQENETAGGGRGLECDKFNTDAVRLQFDRWFGEAMRQVKPEQVGRVLTVFHSDSWECGSQNWSPQFREEFKKRRGYDLLSYLPAMAGIPVESAEVSERFLHDIRQTIADLTLDVFFGTMRELAHEAGCEFTGESTAPVMPGDGMLHYQAVDIPMGEFWLRSPTHDKPNDMRDAISGAHVYGKSIVQAEAFTQLRIAWDEHPGMLKALGDRNYALGINRFSYHVFMQNPWLDRHPGMTLNGVGLFFQRDQTWWPLSKCWVDYARRCQALLQKGRPVVDVAVFTGEELPRRSVLPERLVSILPGLMGDEVVESEAARLMNVGEPQRTMPEGVRHSANMADPEHWTDPLRGYAYNSINPDALLRLATVKDGRIELPGGASYGVIVVPGPRPMFRDADVMSVAVAKKLEELARAGATVIWNTRPQRVPGQASDGGANEELGDIVEKIWQDPENTSSTHPLGKGQIYCGPFTEDSLKEFGLKHDVWVVDEQGNHAGDIAWTHRTAGNAEIYFISNQLDRQRQIKLSLRVVGRKPELWDPVTGEQRVAPQWAISDGCTVLPLRLDAQESLFIVLEDSTELTQQNDGLNWFDPAVVQQLQGDWQVSFDPADGQPEISRTLEDLVDWTTVPDASVRYCSGTATYRKKFEWTQRLTGEDRMWLDLGRVENLASVKLNGVDCGITWTAPFRVEITKVLLVGGNELEIKVANTWHNRLVLAAGRPEDQRTVWMNAPNRLRDKSLLPAGLLGPVRLVTR